MTTMIRHERSNALTLFMVFGYDNNIFINVNCAVVFVYFCIRSMDDNTPGTE